MWACGFKYVCPSTFQSVRALVRVSGGWPRLAALTFIECVDLQAQMKLDSVWDAYMNIQRAVGLTILLKKEKELEKEQDIKGLGKQSEEDIDWLETDSDKLLKQIEDILLQVEVKMQSDKKPTGDFIYVSGFSSTGGTGIKKSEGQQQFTDLAVQPLPQLRNRIVLQVSCGDNHTLALVQGCSCRASFVPNFDCLGQELCNGGVQVFGWG